MANYKKILLSGELVDLQNSFKMLVGNDLVEYGGVINPNPPGDTPTPEPLPTGDGGLLWSDAEVTIWRRRAGLESGDKGEGFDTSPAATADHWNTLILAEANKCKANPLFDRYNILNDGPVSNTSPDYRGYYDDNAKTCVSDQTKPITWCKTYAVEPRPESRNNHSATQAAFVFLLTGDETYAQAVRTALLSYVNDPKFNFWNTAKWVRGSNSIHDLNPGFYIAEWVGKLMVTYDYCKYSTSFSDSDKTAIKNWFLGAADWCDSIYNGDLNGQVAGRYTNNYVVGDYSNRVEGYLWKNGPREYTLTRHYNNRRLHYIKTAMLIGMKYSNAGLISRAAETFKEFIAYGTVQPDTICTELYRGRDADPELGLSYYGVMQQSMIQIADVYARHINNSLYQYSINQADFDKFFKSNQFRNGVKTAYYDAVAHTGKSFYKWLNQLMGYFDNSYGNTRQWNNENIDGKDFRNNREYNYDHQTGQANNFWKNARWRDIYNRKAGVATYAMKSGYTYYGSYKPWFGCFGQNASQWFMYCNMEDLVYPYKS